MAVGHEPENVAKVGIGLDVVELCRGDERTDRCPSLSAAIGTGEQMVLAPERNCPFILPMSGRSWRFSTAGTPILAARFGFARSRSALTAVI